MDDDLVAERTELFLIESSGECHAYSLDHPDLVFDSVENADRMSRSPFVGDNMVDMLWREKDRMDALFDEDNSVYYYAARDQLYPQDTRGSNNFWNRAGDKLNEIVQAVDLLEGISGEFCFIDACGAPGAFTQLLLGYDGKATDRPSPTSRHGYGMSIRLDDTPDSEVWYRRLEHERRFTITYGHDGTGNIYVPENLEKVKRIIENDRNHSILRMFVSDGGFEIRRRNGRHMENFQELFSGRIILGEVLLMMMTLQERGHFVCKMFDTFSSLSVSMIYVVSRVFEKCHIVKPRRSRIVNSERYLVGKFLKSRTSPEFQNLLENLTEIHKKLQQENPGDPHVLSPKSAVPLESMTSDSAFNSAVRHMIQTLADKQTRCLKCVMDLAKSKQQNEPDLRRQDRHSRAPYIRDGYRRQNRHYDRYDPYRDPRDSRDSRSSSRYRRSDGHDRHADARDPHRDSRRSHRERS